MRYRRLGTTGLEVSEIGIGGIGPMGKYGPIAADGTSAQNPGKPTGSYRGNPHFEVVPEGFARTMARAEELGDNTGEIEAEPATRGPLLSRGGAPQLWPRPGSGA